jgi:hypothetical protein
MVSYHGQTLPIAQPAKALGLFMFGDYPDREPAMHMSLL